jgi:transcriptional regulator with XRE-family HTH domain
MGAEQDRQVGLRIRGRRLALGLTLQQVADAVGISVQQLQKYEGGINRVFPSRMQQITVALQTPIADFYEDRPPPGTGATGLGASYVTEFLALPDALALAQRFLDIDDPRLRRAIVRFAESLAHDKRCNRDDEIDHDEVGQ